MRYRHISDSSERNGIEFFIVSVTHKTLYKVPFLSEMNLCLCVSQVAHSTCGDSEYNLRSRTVVCGSCGLPSDKSSNCSVTSASRSFRSGGLSEGLLPQSYVFSSTPRKVGQGSQPLSSSGREELNQLNSFCSSLLRLDPGWRTVRSCETVVPPGDTSSSLTPSLDTLNDS